MKSLLNSQPDILKGKIWKSLVLLSLPIIISNLFQTFYNITDAFWLGKLGRTALAAPTITFSTIFTIIAMASGLAVGGTTLVGQYKGAGKEDKVREVAGNTFTLVFIIAIILSVCGLIFSEDILKLLKTPDDAFVQTLQYMRIIVSGIPFIFSFYVFQGVLQGYGNTISPMKISAFTVIINLVLDPILIFGLGPIPKMGVMGAGIATLFSQLLASVIGVTFLFTGKYGIRLHIRDLKPKLKSIRNILKIGLPVSFAYTGTALGFTVLMGLVNTLGSGVVSAFGVGNRIISILVMPAMGLANGNAIMVAQN
ncbi:MATE family efflux transporter, partial [candidate division WOR-3 bacterium]|nr:MATE family efflux transporter [candidate division WOR-3 bacterium]